MPVVPRRRSTALAAAAALGLVLSGCAGAAHQTESGALELKFADSFSPTHPIGVGGVTPFLEAIEADGDEAGLAIDYFGNGQLGKQTEIAGLLNDHVIDIGAVTPSTVGTELPLSTVGDLPGLIQDACSGADALLAAMQEGSTLFEEELEPRGIHPLWVAVVPRFEAMTADKPIKSVEDLAGLRLRSTGGPADRMVSHVGGAGVSMVLSDVYEAVTQGTVDGTVASPASVGAYKLSEVMGYSTKDARLGNAPVVFSISEEVWDELDDQQQALLLDASATAQASVCQAMEKAVDAEIEVMEKDGVVFHEVTADERPTWDTYAEAARDEWVRDLASIGLPSQQVLDEFTAALEEAQS